MLFLLFLSLLGFHEAAPQCITGWTRFQLSCYKIIENKVDWIDANNYCKVFGASLVEMATRDEINFTIKAFANNHLNSGMWIGLSDILDEGVWIWTSERIPAMETDWAVGQPDNHKDHNQEEDCALLDSDHLWHDEVCEYKHYFMCQMSPDNGLAFG